MKNNKLTVVFFIIFFLVFLPMKFAILSVFGTEVLGKVELLTPICNQNNNAMNTRPTVYVVYEINKIRHFVSGRRTDEAFYFCKLKIGDAIKVTYVKFLNFDYVVADIDDPVANFIFYFIAGLIFSSAPILVLMKE